jgi:hypothetical protein
MGITAERITHANRRAGWNVDCRINEDYIAITGGVDGVEQFFEVGYRNRVICGEGRDTQYHHKQYRERRGDYKTSHGHTTSIISATTIPQAAFDCKN